MPNAIRVASVTVPYGYANRVSVSARAGIVTSPGVGTRKMPAQAWRRVQ